MATPPSLSAESLWQQASKPHIHHVALGVFDGVHLGHQAVIQNVRSLARTSETTAVLSFDPHPLSIINPARAPQRLTTLEQRFELVQKFGIGEMTAVKFDEATRSSSAEDFILQLHRIFPNLQSISIGPNWSFGKNREGNATVLAEWGQTHHFEVHTISPVAFEGQPISSTRIREAIRSHNFELVAKLLGREYMIYGQVAQGSQRGKQLGFPTANLENIPQMLPPGGVYCSLASWGEQQAVAIVNIGTRPTFEASAKISVEAHLLDTEADLYGQKLTLEKFRFLRGERKFAHPDDLIRQIKQDRELALKMELTR